MSQVGTAHSDRPPTRSARIQRILVVDRDPRSGAAMRLALEEAGYYLNLVRDPQEGRRRLFERVYELTLLSASLGEVAVRAILASAARLAQPPAAIVAAAEGELGSLEEAVRGPRLRILRRPCGREELLGAARALVGEPWTERTKGA
jgi:DNA-binding response OmpR family regulator